MTEGRTGAKKHLNDKKHEIESQKTDFSNSVAKKRNFLPILIAIVSISVATGYLAGTFNEQILSFVKPVFGIKSFSGELDTSSLQKVYKILNEKYDGKLDAEKLIQGANEGMVEAVGDTYTDYMGVKESEEFNKGLTGSIGGGIGAEISTKDNRPLIVRVLKGFPAEAAKLQANDVIVAVNDQSTEGWTVEKAVGQIRGEIGTTVKISVIRGDSVKDFTITRENITTPSVESEVNGEVGQLTISRFDANTSNSARKAAEEFVSKGVKSVVLDLRGNTGGYVDAAAKVAGLWLNNKIVATEKNNTGTINVPFKTNNNAILGDMPTVILVNGASASASEILAGALRDHNKAKLVGTNTYGKGCVQELINFDDGSQLKVTVANWYTPKNHNINEKGLAPDEVVELTQADIDNGKDPQLDKAKELLSK